MLQNWNENRIHLLQNAFGLQSDFFFNRIKFFERGYKYLFSTNTFIWKKKDFVKIIHIFFLKIFFFFSTCYIWTTVSGIIDKTYLISWLHKVIWNCYFLMKVPFELITFSEPLHLKDPCFPKAVIPFHKSYFSEDAFLRTGNFLLLTSFSSYTFHSPFN